MLDKGDAIMADHGFDIEKDLILRDVRLNIPTFSNQACTGSRPARAWFLEITLMRTSVCVCACLCVRPPGY